MGTYSYTVSRFVPDPIRNEPVNIGVIVVDAETGETAHRFMHNLRALRPRCPGADLESLGKMVKSFRVYDMPGGADDLECLAQGYTNLLQFTPPRAVAAPTLADSLRHAFEVYIDEEAGQEKEARPKTLLLEEIDAALLSDNIAVGAVKKRPKFAGRRGRFTPDRGVFGDGWTLALHAISFRAMAGTASALSAAKVLAVDFDDARAKNDALECTVVAEPPSGDASGWIESYKQATGHLKDRGCKMIRPGGIKACVRQIGQRLGRLDRRGRPLLRSHV